MSEREIEQVIPETSAAALGEDYALNPEFVRAVCDALDSGDHALVCKLFLQLHEADQADLLGLVRVGERVGLVEALGSQISSEVLTELDDDIREEILALLPAKDLAAAVSELPSDDAADLLEDLDEKRIKEVLDQVSDVDRAAVELNLGYEEGTAGRLMQREVITVPPYWTVSQTVNHLRDTEIDEGVFHDLFVVDPLFHPIGSVPLSRLIRSSDETLIGDLMNTKQHTVPVDMEDEEVAYLFNQYHLISAPVVDGDNRVVGMLTVDDVVSLVHEVASEDMLALAGVGEEGLSDSIIETTRHRFSWLLVNLGTAILASIAIAIFDDTIAEFVSLAILMPIVASMGGNAGTQTLTVAVRALATKDLTATNAARIVLRETLVGGLNGVIFAIIMGALAGLWTGNWVIGTVLGLAMVVNLLFAGLVGILVPLMFERTGVDPAVGSSVFVTTITDIVGFMVFLGLATMFLIG